MKISNANQAWEIKTENIDLKHHLLKYYFTQLITTFFKVDVKTKICCKNPLTFTVKETSFLILLWKLIQVKFESDVYKSHEFKYRRFSCIL